MVSRIGTGRYGVCFLARDPAGKMVVLKRFRTGMRRKHPDFSQQEAVILSGLDHPAVPELLGVINDRSGYYFVLEYQKGKTLKEWLFEEKKFFQMKRSFGSGAIFWMSFSICTKEMWCMEISAWQTWCMTAAGQRLSILDSPGMLTGTVCVSAWIMQDLQMCCCIFCIPDIPGTGRNPGMRHFHCLTDRKIICRKC